MLKSILKNGGTAINAKNKINVSLLQYILPKLNCVRGTRYPISLITSSY